jgi:hypothetical protein
MSPPSNSNRGAAASPERRLRAARPRPTLMDTGLVAPTLIGHPLPFRPDLGALPLTRAWS